MPFARAGRFAALLGLLALFWIASACAPRATPTPTPSPTPLSTSTPTPSAEYSGVLRLAQSGDPTSCDLAMWRGVAYQSVHVCNPMLNQLVRIDPADHSRILPDLAEGWTSGEDGTLWTFYLAKGVRWHDGQPLTADDVVFSLKRIMETPPKLQPGRASPVAQYIESVEAPTPDTVVIRTRFPAASFLLNLASVYVSIYPRHVVEALDPPTMEAFSSVVGSGPFKYRAFTPGSSYEMERNPDYFLRGWPLLKGVTYLVMPNPATQFAALRAHQVDVIPIGITESQAREISQSLSSSITIQETATANFWAVQLNTKTPPFDDPQVREAVNLAIDRQAAIQFQGGGRRGASMPPSGQWGLPDAELDSLPGFGDKAAERARARELLARAGYDSSARLNMLTRSGAFFQDIATFVAGQLETVGIQVEQDTQESAVYLERLRSRSFQLTASSSGLTLDDPDQVFSEHYLCNGTENFSQLCDEEVERLFLEQQRTLDQQRRRELVWQMQRRLWQLNGKVVVHWSVRRTPVWREVQGFTMGASNYQGMRLDTVWKKQ